MTQRTSTVPAKVMTVVTATDDVTGPIRAVLVSGGPVEFLGAVTGGTPADREGAIPVRNMGDGFDGTQTLDALFGDPTIVRLYVLAEAEAIISVAY